MCEHCDRHYAALFSSRCTDCIFDTTVHAAEFVLTHIDTLAFLITHDINPVTDSWRPVTGDADEEILSVEPFAARFTFTIGSDTLTLTVDDDLTVVDVEKGTSSNPA